VRQGSRLPKPQLRIFDLSSNQPVNSEAELASETKSIKDKPLPIKQQSKISSSFKNSISSEDGKESYTVRESETGESESDHKVITAPSQIFITNTQHKLLKL